MLAIVGVGSVADAAPSNRCAGATVTTRTASPSPTGWAENLTFDHSGNLWVSRLYGNSVERYDRSGRRTATVPARAPGALRMSGGDLYVNSGDQLSFGTERNGVVVKFDPLAPQPNPTVYARGFAMPNGLAFDARGFGYVVDSLRGVVRIAPGGAIDQWWTDRARAALAASSAVNGISPNGAVVIGNDLYLTFTASRTGRVVALPLDDPGPIRVVADLTAPLPGLLDDLTALDPHTVAVTSTLGSLALVDVRTGARCTIALGAPATAVAVQPSDSRVLVVASETGALLDVRLAG
ncbi:SMP-30/gluconolactonase/LRE family protein [Gordonia sputi]